MRISFHDGERRQLLLAYEHGKSLNDLQDLFDGERYDIFGGGAALVLTRGVWNQVFSMDDPEMNYDSARALAIDYILKHEKIKGLKECELTCHDQCTKPICGASPPAAEPRPPRHRRDVCLMSWGAPDSLVALHTGSTDAGAKDLMANYKCLLAYAPTVSTVLTAWIDKEKKGYQEIKEAVWSAAEAVVRNNKKEAQATRDHVTEGNMKNESLLVELLASAKKTAKQQDEMNEKLLKMEQQQKEAKEAAAQQALKAADPPVQAVALAVIDDEHPGCVEIKTFTKDSRFNSHIGWRPRRRRRRCRRRTRRRSPRARSRTRRRSGAWTSPRSPNSSLRRRTPRRRWRRP